MTPTRARLAEALESLSADARAMIRDLQYGKPLSDLQVDSDGIHEAWERVTEAYETLQEEEV